MTYEDQKFEKSYEKNKKSYNESYSFDRVTGKYAPVQIKLTAEVAPAIYSFSLSPVVSNISNIARLNPG